MQTYTTVAAKTLEQASIDPAVRKAFADWKKAGFTRGVLIGGLALSFYARPRYTQDIDILVLDLDKLGTSSDFKKHRPSALEHKQTGVEIELVTPKLLGISEALAEKVMLNATIIDGIRVASREGLIALKLYAATSNPRRFRQDTADVVNLLEGQGGHIDLAKLASDWQLTEQQQIILRQCFAESLLEK